MRHITMTCPECRVPNKAVGDPNENDNGASGEWYCFNCGKYGFYDINFTLHNP
jgi:hypothetical protein